MTVAVERYSVRVVYTWFYICHFCCNRNMPKCQKGKVIFKQEFSRVLGVSNIEEGTGQNLMCTITISAVIQL